MKQKKLFGTDGVRGTANVEPVTAETALKLGVPRPTSSRTSIPNPGAMAATRS
jgi:phosphomannomutase